MSLPLNILGKRFGKLVAVEELAKEAGMRKWRLVCDCGNEVVALQKSFCSGGHRRSCGCANIKPQVRHGRSSTPEYRAWINMRTRCYDETTPYYGIWGGRGIRVCDRWLNSFEGFLTDVGRRPSHQHSLDRIDVNGHYEPGNVRWALQKIQSRNQRRNHLVVLHGQTMTLADAVEIAPVTYNTVLYRLKRGWSIDDAVYLPARKGQRPHVA